MSKKKAKKKPTKAQRMRADTAKALNARARKIARKKSKQMATVDIGGTVRHFRTQAGMSTTDLAKKSGVSQAQISRLENNQQGFRSSTLMTIAKAINVRPWVLFMTEIERAAAEKSIGLR
jgi:ribosome-binding protein aMBF1 (putative translation factor)